MASQDKTELSPRITGHFLYLDVPEDHIPWRPHMKDDMYIHVKKEEDNEEEEDVYLPICPDWPGWSGYVPEDLPTLEDDL